MLDPKLLRKDARQVATALARRGAVDLDPAEYEELEERRKAAQVEAETLRAERNKRSRSIGQAKAAGEDIAPLLAEIEDLGSRQKSAQDKLSAAQRDLRESN